MCVYSITLVSKMQNQCFVFFCKSMKQIDSDGPLQQGSATFPLCNAIFEIGS